MRYVFLIVLFVSFKVYADELTNMYSMLDARLASPSLLEEGITLGEERAAVCMFCHGKKGNSRRGNIPNLAGQNTKYIVNQFEMFATNQRDNSFMREQAKNLSSENRVNIALFFSSQKAKPRSEISPDQSAKGSKIFMAQCSGCHGKDGHGKDMIPRIASQPAKYLNKTLNIYRTEPEKRSTSPMLGIVRTLSKEDQAIVTVYLSSIS